VAVSTIPFNGDTSWTSLNAYIKVKKVGNIVTVMGVSAGQLTLTKDSWNGLAALPVGYRPSEAVSFVGMDRQSLPYAMMCRITTDGSIEAMPEVGNTSYWLLEVSFPL
jgi:hypothetical protein